MRPFYNHRFTRGRLKMADWLHGLRQRKKQGRMVATPINMKMKMKGMSGQIRFADLSVGAHFFFVGANVPCKKVGEGCAMEGASAIAIEVGADTRVVPLLFYRTQTGYCVRVGYYRVFFDFWEVGLEGGNVFAGDIQQGTGDGEGTKPV